MSAASQGTPSRPPARRSRRRRGALLAGALAVAAPTTLWLLLFVCVPPSRQEFPLNDDCLYSRTAFGFLHGRGLNYYNQASMPLLGQMVWAAPFVWLGGDTHVALRLATMSLGAVAVASFYDLLRQSFAFAPARAAIAAASLGLNPLFFLTASMFHSDVPALAFSLLSLALYARGWRRGSLAWWLAGAAAAVAAVATRQNAFVVPIAAAFFLRRQGRLWKFQWLAGVFVPAAAAVAIMAWMNGRPDAPRISPNLGSLLAAPMLLYLCAHTAGLSSLPVLALPARWYSWIFAVTSIALLGWAATLAYMEVPPYGGLFPYLGSFITPWGQFDCGDILQGDRPELLGRDVRVALTALGCVAFGAICSRLIPRPARRNVCSPLGVFTLLHLGILHVSPVLFDRYILVLLPGALAAATGRGRANRGRVAASVVMLVVFGAASFASVHDFLVWNSAAWDVGRRAVARGIAPTEIEGGFPWDGWHSPGAAKEKIDRPPRGLQLPITRITFPYVTARYAVSFSVLPGTVALDLERFRLWLIPGEQHMYLIRIDDRPRQQRREQPPQ